MTYPRAAPVAAGAVATIGGAAAASAQDFSVTADGALSGDPGQVLDLLFLPYSPALAALAGWTLLTMVLTFVSTRGTPRARAGSGHPVRDYADPVYRRSRAHMNAVETTGPFIAALVAAILTGASPFWVNALTILFLLARIGMAAAHIATENQPLRSGFFALGQLCVILLAGFAIAGALTS